jgi:antitoxin CptB
MTDERLTALKTRPGHWYFCLGHQAMTAELDPRRRRASYRAAHRGTKEMDWLLGRYAEARLAGMSDDELTHFEELLQEEDPVMQIWIMDLTAVPAARFAGLIGEIRAFHKLGVAA